jgi:hypothetical protein
MIKGSLNEIENQIDEMSLKDLEELMSWVGDYETPPVHMEQFLEDPDYLGSYLGESLFPYWKRILCDEIYPSPMVEKYWLICLRGSIGKGKTTISTICIAYELYKLLCRMNPQKSFGLIPSSKIVFAILNRTLTLSTDVVWDRLSQLFTKSPYFAKTLNPKRLRNKEETLFPKRIDFAMGSRFGHTLGQDVLYSILDEANFNVVENQMYQVFNSILARMESRFMKPGGGIAGKVFVVSSESDTFSTVNQIVDKYKKTPGVYVDQSAIWEVVTHKNSIPLYSGRKFWVFKGTETRQPEILPESSTTITQDPDNCLPVPVEHYDRFEADIHAALRDLGGISTSSTYKLFRLKERLHRNLIINPVFPDVIRLDFDDETDQIINYCNQPGFFESPVDHLRYIYIDMALSGDRLGIGCAYVRNFRERKSRDINTFQEVIETVPEVVLEWATAIEAVPGKQIPLYKIRLFLLQLSRKGYMIGKVTADLHMLSADTLQGLQKAGFETEYVSVDKTATPYFVMRNMVYEDRLYLPNMKLLKTELSELEVSPDGTKVDHPIKGSKDIADGVCGAVYTASNNAERNKLLYIANHHKSSANEDVVDLFWGSR